MQSPREIASGVVNLGSTCYMNAVLQALAHSPELCSAIECESHIKDCPIAALNARGINGGALKGENNGEDHLYVNDIGIQTAAISTKNNDYNNNGTKRRKSINGDTDENGIGYVNSSNYGKEEKFCLLCEIEKLLIEVHNNAGSPVAPSAFVNGFISHVAPWFKLGVQEDSHEFLRLLIEAMQKSCTGKQSDVDTADENLQESDNPIKTHKDRDGNKENDEDTDLDRNEYAFRLFRGKVESIVKCSNCSAVSSTIDPIEDIGLEVTAPTVNLNRTQNRGRVSPSPSSSSSSTLFDVMGALKQFVTMEKLDCGYKCESCGRVGQATKQSRLASIPPILTLHLKRFRYGSDRGNNLIQPAIPSRRRNTELASLLGNGDLGTSGSAKIEGHVKFSLVLDIQPYLTQEKQKEVGKSMLCRLFAIVVHAGKNSHSGHYICYVQNIAKNEWWKMDDAKITKVSLAEVIAAEAYMLFYRVVDHPVSVELRNKEKALKEGIAAAEAEVAVKETSEIESLKSKEDHSDDSKASPQSPKNHRNKRKRDEPKYKSGHDWARTMTNLPDTWMPFLQKIQDVLSDHCQLKSEYFNLLEDEAKAGGTLGAGPSIGIEADDIQGGIQGLRVALRDMFKTILPERKELIHQLLNYVTFGSEPAAKKAQAADDVDANLSENNENNEFGGDDDSVFDGFLFPLDDSNENML